MAGGKAISDTDALYLNAPILDTDNEQLKNKIKVTSEKPGLWGRYLLFTIKREAKEKLLSIYEDREAMITFMQNYFAQKFYFLTFEENLDYFDRVICDKKNPNDPEKKWYLVKR